MRFRKNYFHTSNDIENYPVPIVADATIATTGDEMLCSGETTNIVVSNPNNVAGTAYAWTVFSSVNVTNAVPGTGDHITQTLTSTDGINVGTVV